MNTPNIDTTPRAGGFPTSYGHGDDERELYVKMRDGEYTPLVEFFGHTVVYVNTHLVDRACGGAEEGGWWFDYGEPVESIRTPASDAARVYAEAMKRADQENGQRRSDTSSVISEGRYEVSIETHYATGFPTEAPHYE